MEANLTLWVNGTPSNSVTSLSPTPVYSGSSCDNTSACIAVPTNGSMPQCKPQEYYSPNYAIVGTLFQSIIFTVGVLGNVLVCAVVRRTRSMHSTTNCYLVSLAMADTITLVASVPQEVLSYHILGDQWVWGSVGCTLMIYLQYLGIDASALSLTAFTVERYIAICHPMKSKSICTISRAKKIIVACWVFAIVYCSPWFFLTQTRSVCVRGVGQVTTCGFRLRRDSTEYLVMFFTDILLFYVLPLILSVVLYLLIARMLLTNSKNKFPGGLSNGTAMSVSEAAAKSNQSRVQVVKMLACVVMIFATLWIPYRGLLVYNSLATINSLPPYLDLWYLMFAKTCIYMNCAINPILYNAMSDKFRKAFRRFLSCGKLTDSAHNHLYCYNQDHSRLSPHPTAVATSSTNITANLATSHSTVQRTLSSPRYMRSISPHRSFLSPADDGPLAAAPARRHSAFVASCPTTPHAHGQQHIPPHSHLSPNWTASAASTSASSPLSLQHPGDLLATCPPMGSADPVSPSSSPAPSPPPLHSRVTRSKVVTVSVATQAGGGTSKGNAPRKTPKTSFLSVIKPSRLTARSLASSTTQETIF